MASKKRKIMFSFFILIFIMTASFVVIYAQGYRLQLSWPLKLNEALQKTGMLVLKTEPEEARIYINNTFQSYLSNKLVNREEEEYTQTPAKIKYLMPGEYKVTIEKEGYWTWEKRVTIKPGKQTRMEDIRLFKKTLPRRMVEIPFQDIHFSPNKKWVISEEGKELIDLDQGTIQNIPAYNNKKNNIAWSPDDSFFAAGGRIYDAATLKSPIDLKQEPKDKITNTKWENDSELHYQTDKHTLKELNIDPQNDKVLLETKGEILAYVTISDYIHTVIKNEEKIKYQIFSQDEQRMVRKIEIPYSTDYEFINKDHFLINLYDKKNESLYLIEPHALFDPIRHHIQEVEYTEWKDDHTLLYANDFEIWNYNINNNTKDLITRISSPILGVDKPFEDDYIIFYTDKNINIIEKRKNTPNKTTELIQLNGIRSPNFDKDKNVIYFNGKIGDRTGIYKLQI